MPMTRTDIERYFVVGDIFPSVTRRANYEIKAIEDTRVRIQPTAAKTQLRLDYQKLSLVFDCLDSINMNDVTNSVRRLLRQFGNEETTTESHPYAFAREYRERARNAELRRRDDVLHAPLPEEVIGPAPLYEGAVSQVPINAYERSPEARRRCIDVHGTTCSICRFDFGHAYGEVAHGFIHVHHLRPLSEIRTGYEVDPVNDLRPVCPNCHAVLHRRVPLYCIEEVRAFLRGRVIKAVLPNGPRGRPGPARRHSELEGTFVGFSC